MSTLKSQNTDQTRNTATDPKNRQMFDLLPIDEKVERLDENTFKNSQASDPINTNQLCQNKIQNQSEFKKDAIIINSYTNKVADTSKELQTRFAGFGVFSSSTATIKDVNLVQCYTESTGSKPPLANNPRQSTDGLFQAAETFTVAENTNSDTKDFTKTPFQGSLIYATSNKPKPLDFLIPAIPKLDINLPPIVPLEQINISTQENNNRFAKHRTNNQLSPDLEVSNLDQGNQDNQLDLNYIGFEAHATTELNTSASKSEPDDISYKSPQGESFSGRISNRTKIGNRDGIASRLRSRKHSSIPASLSQSLNENSGPNSNSNSNSNAQGSSSSELSNLNHKQKSADTLHSPIAQSATSKQAFKSVLSNIKPAQLDRITRVNTSKNSEYQTVKIEFVTIIKNTTRPVPPFEDSFQASEDDEIDKNNSYGNDNETQGGIENNANSENNDISDDDDYVDCASEKEFLNNNVKIIESQPSTQDESKITTRNYYVDKKDINFYDDKGIPDMSGNESIDTSEELIYDDLSWKLECVTVYPVIQENYDSDHENDAGPDKNIYTDPSTEQTISSQHYKIQNQSQDVNQNQPLSESHQTSPMTRNQRGSILNANQACDVEPPSSNAPKKKINWGNCYLFKSVSSTRKTSTDLDSQSTLKESTESLAESEVETLTESKKVMENKPLKPIIKLAEDTSQYINLKTTRIANGYSKRSKKTGFNLIKVRKYRYLDDESDSDF